MPDSLAPLVRRPVRRSPSATKEVAPLVRKLSIGEGGREEGRPGSLREEGRPASLHRVRRVKEKTSPAQETARERLMRDDDLPPAYVPTRPFVSVSSTAAVSAAPASRASPEDNKAARARRPKTTVSLSLSLNRSDSSPSVRLTDAKTSSLRLDPTCHLQNLLH